MAHIDFIVGACTQARYVLLALRKGDTQQILRALCFQIMHLGAEGKAEEDPKGRAPPAAARQLASEIGRDGEALFQQSCAAGLYLCGRYAACVDALDAAPRT